MFTGAGQGVEIDRIILAAVCVQIAGMLKFKYLASIVNMKGCIDSFCVVLKCSGHRNKTVAFSPWIH